MWLSWRHILSMKLQTKGSKRKQEPTDKKKHLCTTASWPTTACWQKRSEKTPTRMCNAVIVQFVRLHCNPPPHCIALHCSVLMMSMSTNDSLIFATVGLILDGQESRQVATGVIALLKAVTKCPHLGGGHLEYRTNCDSGRWHPGRNAVKALRLFTCLVESD